MAAKKPAAPESVRVRILAETIVDGIRHACNTVAEFDAATAAALVRDGVADDHAEAVKAAE